MPINGEYRGPGELPQVTPVFPLPGALLLPRGQMPLNIFEPRYLAMVDDSLRDGHRLIGMIQPDVSHSRDEAKPALFSVGTLDPLLDDTLFMAARWRSAGNPAELAVYPGGIHAFNLFPIPLAEKANVRALDFLANARDAV